MAETQRAPVTKPVPESAPEIPKHPTVPDYLAEEKAEAEARRARYKKNERRDQLLVFVAAALAGDDQAGASPKSKAIRAVVIAEETIEQLVERGHLE